jgi:class 3 adenylate cyclase
MRYCGMCGRAFTAGAAERERRRVSVVFVDLTGFSTLTHGLDPEELRDLADHVLTEVAGVIENYDGHVDAFRGDGLIALFGAPHSHPDDPYRAVVAAEASLHAIERVGRARGVDLRGRAGVTTGVVIAGAVGSGRVREYTVMGSTVNLASRLENAAGPGEVWVGAETYEATRHQLTFEVVQDVKLPGFPTVTSVHRLVSSERRDPDPYGKVPFVGRERELAQLEAWHRTVHRRRRPRLVWVNGEAGSGKTRLLREFAGRVAAGGTTRVVWLRSDPQEGFSWSAVARQVFDVADTADDRARAERVRVALQELLPGQTRWHRLVLATLEMEPSPTWRRLERRGVDRKLVAWRDVFAATAQRTSGADSLVVLVESDRYEPTLDAFLEGLAEAEAPLLVVRTSRARKLRTGADTLTLEPLSLDESMALFRQVADPLFERAGRALVAQVGGVPASVFELGRALSITQDTHFRGSLTSLLQARLDMLDPRARRLLAMAAVCGERTWEGLLRAAFGDVRAELKSLRQSDILVRGPVSSLPGEVEYRFRSELLRHAVLEMTPFSDRPELHLRVATWLEQLSPLAFSEEIGAHFEEGGAGDAAYGHYLAAADEAEAMDDPERADRLYRHLAALDVPPDLRAQGALAYAQAALARGDRELALAQLDLARATLALCELESCVQMRATEERLRADLAAMAAVRGSEPRRNRRAVPAAGGTD